MIQVVGWLCIVGALCCLIRAATLIRRRDDQLLAGWLYGCLAMTLFTLGTFLVPAGSP